MRPIPLQLRPARLALAALALVACVAPPPRAPADAPGEARASAVPFELALWRAGRGIPPALSATRRDELRTERAQALAELARDFGRSDEARLRAWLDDESTPDELWAAGARVVAGLELYSLAPSLLAALAPAAAPARGAVAREALHTLYGHWFALPAEVEPYLGSVVAGEGTRLLLASAAREEERSRARLLASLEPTPAAAAAWLGDPDPLVRSGAARLLAREFTRPGGEGAATLARLFAQLEREPEPEAFHALLGAALAPLERAPDGDADLARLQALLLQLSAAPADLRTLSVVEAFTRLPWRTRGARDAGHLARAIEGLAAWLGDLCARDHLRGANDPDPLLGVLGALHELCARARAAAPGEPLGDDSVRAAVLAVFEDPTQDPSVRTVAVRTLGVLARGEDGLLLARALEDPALPGPVQHALLGALRELLAAAEVPPDGRRALAAAAARLSAASDVDVRTRALALCADARLADEMRALEASFLVARLGLETEVENARTLLELLQRFGGADELAALLSLEGFERLAGDEATLEPLVATLAKLSRGTPRAAVRSALRLAAVERDTTRLACLRHALELVAGLDELGALDLAPREHRAVAEWVWRLDRAGIAPREATSRGLDFERRVLEIHLERGQRDAGGDEAALTPAERAHLVARLRADLCLGSVAGTTKPQVESAFEQALELAPGSEAWLVLRDRARFRAALNERLRALADYRRLLESGPEAEATLGIPDLRSAIELLGRLDETGGPGPSTSAAEACDLLARLVARPAWRSEPAAVRMQDLRAWVQSALEARERGRLGAVESALASLPLTQAEAQGDGAAPLWSGLTRESAWFQELLDLRARVRLTLRELEARG